MNAKTTGIVAYISCIGLIIAFLAGDKEGAKFHINQALVIFLCGFAAGFVGVILTMVLGQIGMILYYILVIAFVILWILGLVYACKEEEKEVPLIGKIKILK